jgi:hypothetical protein
MPDQQPTQFTPPSPSWPREDGAEQMGSTNMPPVGPQTLPPQPSQFPVRDSYERDLAHGPRFPPPGPSAPLAVKPRSRPTNENPPSDDAHHRSEWEADIDVLRSRSGPRDVPIKNSGMYADRESVNDSLPTGPRYRRFSAFPTGPSADAVSPTTPLIPHRTPSGHEQADLRPKASSPRMSSTIDNDWQQHPRQKGSTREGEQQRWTPAAPRDRNVVQSQVGRQGQGHIAMEYAYVSLLIVSQPWSYTLPGAARARLVQKPTSFRSSTRAIRGHALSGCWHEQYSRWF